MAQRRLPAHGGLIGLIVAGGINCLVLGLLGLTILLGSHIAVMELSVAALSLSVGLLIIAGATAVERRAVIAHFHLSTTGSGKNQQQTNKAFYLHCPIA